MKQVRVTLKIDLEVDVDGKGRLNEDDLRETLHQYLEEHMEESSLEYTVKVTDNEDDELVDLEPEDYED